MPWPLVRSGRRLFSFREQLGHEPLSLTDTLDFHRDGFHGALDPLHAVFDISTGALGRATEFRHVLAMAKPTEHERHAAGDAKHDGNDDDFGIDHGYTASESELKVKSRTLIVGM